MDNLPQSPAPRQPPLPPAPPKPAPTRTSNRVQKPVDPHQDKIAALIKENKSLRSKITRYETTLDTLSERQAAVKGQQAEQVRVLEARARMLEARVRELEDQVRVSCGGVPKGSGGRDGELVDAANTVAALNAKLREAQVENRWLRVALESLTTLVPLPGEEEAAGKGGGGVVREATATGQQAQAECTASEGNGMETGSKE